MDIVLIIIFGVLLVVVAFYLMIRAGLYDDSSATNADNNKGFLEITFGDGNGERKYENGKAYLDGIRAKLSEEKQYFIGQKCIGLTPRNGYNKYPIAGVYYRELPFNSVGYFNGYAKADENNNYDKVAIGIYNEYDIHLGFLPKGNTKLHAYILSEGGKVHAYGYIAYGGSWYGEVCVETNKDLVSKRNRPFHSTLNTDKNKEK
jgi:hypothetical protein